MKTITLSDNNYLTLIKLLIDTAQDSLLKEILGLSNSNEHKLITSIKSFSSKIDAIKYLRNNSLNYSQETLQQLFPTVELELYGDTLSLVSAKQCVESILK